MRNFPFLAVIAFVSAILAAPRGARSAGADSGEAAAPADDAAPDAAILAPGVERREIGAAVPSDGPLGVFAAVERAWSEERLDALVATLDPDERVQLSFTLGGPRGGYFNRDQAYFLFKDLFEFTKTDKFEFQKYWNLEEDGRSPYAVADRRFRMNDGARHDDQVYIALRKRGNQWVVGEIRSIVP